MSIDLPRNSKELHFTGSVKALAPERSAHALGQGRPKRPPPSADLYQRDGQRTPYVGARPSERADARNDEDLLTQAIDRDEIKAALFPIARRENASQPAPNLPVPHFRSAAEARAHHAEPAIIVKTPKGGNLPLGVWLMAALLGGIVSYQLAPQAVATVAQAVHARDAR